MKKNPFAVCALTLFFMSFINMTTPNFDTKALMKDFVKIKDDLYVSKFEVTNLDYRNFLADLASQNKIDIYNNSLPDTMVWKNDFTATESLVRYYFRDPSYDSYPVVGVSYESANEYCKWLTEKYNQSASKKDKKVQFRLLSKEEWTFAANKGDNSKVYTWGSGFLQNNRKQYLCNFRHTIFVFDSVSKKYNEFPDTTKSNSSFKTITASVTSYYPNSFGLFNMCGNVAEMVEEKGIAKGGGFDDTGYGVRIESQKTYTKPQADIGFRIGMKIISD